MKTVNPHVAETFEIGAILTDSWGCEQTNIDFYCIVDRKGMWLTVQAMKSSSTQASDMTTTEMPLEIDNTQKPMRKKLKVWDGKESGFSFRDYTGGGWVRLWNGKAQVASHYA